MFFFLSGGEIAPLSAGPGLGLACSFRAAGPGRGRLPVTSDGSFQSARLVSVGLFGNQCAQVMAMARFLYVVGFVWVPAAALAPPGPWLLVRPVSVSLGGAVSSFSVARCSLRRVVCPRCCSGALIGPQRGRGRAAIGSFCSAGQAAAMSSAQFRDPGWAGASFSVGFGLGLAEVCLGVGRAPGCAAAGPPARPLRGQGAPLHSRGGCWSAGLFPAGSFLGTCVVGRGLGDLFLRCLLFVRSCHGVGFSGFLAVGGVRRSTVNLVAARKAPRAVFLN